LICSLPESSQRNSAVQRPKTLFTDDLVDGMSSVPILRSFLGVGEGVHLCLQPDLYNLHRTHDSNSFRNTGAQASCKASKNRKSVKRTAKTAVASDVKHTDEDIADGRLPSFLIGQKVLVRLEARKPNGHFWHDSRKNGAKTFVERQGGFTSDDLGSSSDEPSWFCLSPFDG
jgi:hypothetical protein